MTVYFGEYDLKPDEVDELPKEYRRLLAPERHQLPDYDFWTNNILFVEPFSADEVIICGGSNANMKVCDHPKWPRFKDILGVGEFVSCVYYENLDK